MERLRDEASIDWRAPRRDVRMSDTPMMDPLAMMRSAVVRVTVAVAADVSDGFPHLYDP